MTTMTEPRERPILFSAPMVRAIIEGRKTQTRRAVSDRTSNGNYPASCLLLDDPFTFVDLGLGAGPYLHAPINCAVTEERYHWQPGSCDPSIVERLYPRYAIGDRLWVRETWAAVDDAYPPAGALYRCDPMYDTCTAGDIPWRWRPSIHMPRWASRLTLEITRVRVERVQDISEDDILAEGIEAHEDDGVTYYGPFGKGHADPTREYRRLWDSLNAKRGYGWDRNPFVWVVGFRRVDGAA